MVFTLGFVPRTPAAEPDSMVSTLAPCVRMALCGIAHKGHVFATIAASEVSMASLCKILGHCRRLATAYTHPYEPMQ